VALIQTVLGHRAAMRRFDESGIDIADGIDKLSGVTG
jgi:hypothetical protein